jgi:hypothetical protein
VPRAELVEAAARNGAKQNSAAQERICEERAVVANAAPEQARAEHIALRELVVGKHGRQSSRHKSLGTLAASLTSHGEDAVALRLKARTPGAACELLKKKRRQQAKRHLSCGVALRHFGAADQDRSYGEIDPGAQRGAREDHLD